jgi:hypothetical protein
MAKWMVSACESRTSNFKAILRYHLARYQPLG